MTRMDEFLKQNNRVSGGFESSREVSDRVVRAFPCRLRGAQLPVDPAPGMGWHGAPGPPESVTLMPSQSAFAVLDTML
jgi:hypothetical protein